MPKSLDYPATAVCWSCNRRRVPVDYNPSTGSGLCGECKALLFPGRRRRSPKKDQFEMKLRQSLTAA